MRASQLSKLSPEERAQLAAYLADRGPRRDRDPEKRPLLVQVDEETLRLLGVLGKPAEVLAALARLAAEGVSRPGSWQRGWIEEARGNV